MKMSEIKSMSLKDVETKVDELKNKLFDFRIQKHTSGLEKTHEPKLIRKQIARLLTHKTTLGSKG